MKKLLALLMLICIPAYADISNQLNIEEEDGSPSTFPYKAKFSNGTLTDNLDGTVSISGGSSTPGGANTNIQYNNSGTFSGDPMMTFHNNSNTLSISRDAGQVGQALRISSETGAIVGNISHDGSIFTPKIQTPQASGNIGGGSIELGGTTGVVISGDTGIFRVQDMSNTNENFQVTLSGSNVIGLSSTSGAIFQIGRDFKILDDIDFFMGTGSDIQWQFDTAETTDTFKEGLILNSSTHTGIHAIVETADINTNFGYILVTDPTYIWQGSDASQLLERGWVQYDSTNNYFLLSADTGSIFLRGRTGVSFDTTLVGTSTGNIGWVAVDGTDNTTGDAQCTSACVFGVQNATGTAVTGIVSCTDATADTAVCAGSS